ncbi:MAG: tetratricopeptide repeat protein [Proteobacteria bacterium]|nr:tetratricopeptide repeat protein [Pseudomonadota bacterium]
MLEEQNQAVALHRAGRLDEAEAIYRRILKADPDNAEVLQLLGVVAGQRGDNDECIRLIERAISREPEVAKYHANLGAALRELRRLDEAAQAFERAVALDPSWELPAYFLAALTGETMPAAPASCLQEIFDSYAGYFENYMVQELQYQVPTFIRGLVGRLMEPGRRFDKVIDLGCGTGLSGVQFRDAARCVHGVDLSPRMIEESEKKNVYDRLEVANIQDFLSAPGTRYDLFIATDVFIYIGALEGIFAAISQRAERNALFAFSTEICAGDDYVLAATGRYAHSRPYVEGLARENGFRVGAREQVPLRLESGQPVMGDIYVLQCSSV